MYVYLREKCAGEDLSCIDKSYGDLRRAASKAYEGKPGADEQPGAEKRPKKESQDWWTRGASIAARWVTAPPESSGSDDGRG